MRLTPPFPVIVGVPRSGTTLLRLMLDAHPQLCIPPETGFMIDAAALDGAAPDLRERFVDVLTRYPTWRDMGIGREHLESAVAGCEPFDVGAGLRRFYALVTQREGKPRSGDKTPDYGLHLDAIERLLPEARFIHVIRDGRDVACSVRPLWFAPGRDPISIARDWRRRIERTRALGARRRHYMELRFEDLVSDPARQLRRICDFIDLPFDPAMLAHHERAAERYGEVGDRYADEGALVISREQRLAMQRNSLRPPDPSLIGVWRRELSRWEQLQFRLVAGGLLRELGYAAVRRPKLVLRRPVA